MKMTSGADRAGLVPQTKETIPMAKQLVGPVERHVDKAVLGIAGLALIAVAAQFLVTSPNKLDLRNETVTPKTIDPKVQEFAQSVRQTVRSARPPEHEVEDLSSEFTAVAAEAGTAGTREAWPAVAALLPKVPLVGPPVVIEGEIELIEPPAPQKPRIASGRSTVFLPPDGGFPEGTELLYYTPTNWATVSAIVDVDELRTMQRNEYLPDREEVYFTRIEAQRQRMQPDGTWPETWEDVTLYQPFGADERRQPPDLKLVTEEDRLTVEYGAMNQLEGYFNELKRPNVQLSVLRPMPPEFVSPAYWEMPVITSRTDVLRMDDEYLYPDEKPADVPEDRYPDAPEAAVASTPGEDIEQRETLQEANRRRFREADELLARGNRENNVDLVIQAQNKWHEIMTAMDPRTQQRSPQSDIDRAMKLRQDAEQTILDIQRRRLRNLRGAEGPGGDAKPAAPKRQLLSAQQVWVHDALAGSIKSGATYRYRIRYRLYNRMAGLPNLLRNPQDATIPTIASAWSAPSDPVEIPPDRRYYLATAYDTRNEIGLEFYQWFEGVWTRPRGTEKFGIGDVLRFVARAPLPRRDDPTMADNAELNFGTDATLIDIEFDRPFPERALTRSRGFQFEDQPDTVAAFIDEDGHVFERSMSIDKSHPGRSEIRDKIWKPEPAAAAPKQPPIPGQGPPGKTRRPSRRP